MTAEKSRVPSPRTSSSLARSTSASSTTAPKAASSRTSAWSSSEARCRWSTASARPGRCDTPMRPQKSIWRNRPKPSFPSQKSTKSCRFRPKCAPISQNWTFCVTAKMAGCTASTSTPLLLALPPGCPQWTQNVRWLSQNACWLTSWDEHRGLTSTKRRKIHGPEDEQRPIFPLSLHRRLALSVFEPNQKHLPCAVLPSFASCFHWFCPLRKTVTSSTSKSCRQLT